MASCTSVGTEDRRSFVQVRKGAVEDTWTGEEDPRYLGFDACLHDEP